MNTPFTTDFAALHVSPNPSTGLIDVNKDFYLMPYRVRDLNGQVMQSGVFDKLALDLSAFPSGIYVIESSKNNILFHSKIIINH